MQPFFRYFRFAKSSNTHINVTGRNRSDKQRISDKIGMSVQMEVVLSFLVL